jgi:hypothetical protein
MNAYALAGVIVVVSTAILAIFKRSRKGTVHDSVPQSVLDRIRAQEPFDAGR